jgi:hypothetical protein
MIWPKNTIAGARLLLFLLSVQTVLQAQTVSEPAPIPETGYVSDSRYVNAFFGFLLPLPQDVDFRDFALPSSGKSHSIFGLQTQRKGLTAVTVSATQVTGNPTDDARKAAAGGKGASVKMNGSQSGLDDLRNNSKVAFVPSNSASEQRKPN